MLYQVTSNTGSMTHRPSTPFKRLLAFVLLAFFIYASTAESVHRHGGLLLATQGSSAPKFTAPDDTGSLTRDARASSECLICQLRQQLSFSLLNAPSLNVTPETELTREGATPLPSLSGTDTPQRGRAPPLTSLV